MRLISKKEASEKGIEHLVITEEDFQKYVQQPADEYEDKKYLYYIGWKPRSTTRFGLMTGLAFGLALGWALGLALAGAVLAVLRVVPKCLAC